MRENPHETSVELTDRERAIAEGVGMIERGHSVTWASQQSGVPRVTLWERHRKLLGPNAPNREERFRAAETRIEALAVEVANKGLERMASEIETAEHKTVTAWTSVARDTLSKKRRWERQEEQGAGAGLEKAIHRLGEHGDVTLTVRRRSESEEAIDVTPQEDSDDS